MAEKKEKRTSLLPRISVTRPVTVTMCLVGLMVIGLVAYWRIPIQAWASGNDWNRFGWMLPQKMRRFKSGLTPLRCRWNGICVR